MTAIAALQLVVRHWDDLHELRTARPHDAWPPASLQAYLRTVEEYDPADRSAPVRLHVVDTIRVVEAVLVALADQIAARVQSSPVGPAPADWAARGWTTADRDRRNALSAADAADPARWPFVGTRTGRQAAVWLAARVRGDVGPFRPLTGAELDEVTRVAAGAAERVEHALGIRRRSVGTGRACGCGNELLLEGGDGRPPSLVCRACDRSLTLAESAAA
ncbi:hypothetical protein ACFY15_00550 [Streptomyces sp. NPDC001373]|uniref:hypothetical protein n=1 Tax=Streptomyces sp. NPDC001373 TaxID=3364565 RepID=UPI0036A2CE76